MNYYTLFAFLVLFAVIIHYVNSRLFQIQATIAITMGSVILAVIAIVAHQLNLFDLETPTKLALDEIDFRKWLLDGVLGLFLFGGSLSVNLKVLLDHKWEVGTLALLGTAASTFLIGSLIYMVLHWLGLPLDYIYCLLFGAVISPTDPIAVLATTKEMGARQDLTTKIAGESLFNDGVGLVIFVTLFSIAFTSNQPTWHSVTILFLREALGGIVYGLAIGWFGYWLIKPIKDPKLEILITLCIATAGYIFAQSLQISGPLAMVTAGLIIGNLARQKVMTEHGRLHLDIFWELTDELLNAVLFLLIGLEVVALNTSATLVLAGVIAIPCVLLVRFITVGVPMSLFKRKRSYAPYVITILTWGGLRGGLALAMALSLPSGHFRDTILLLTYCVVLFSIIVQGLTAKPLVRLAEPK